MTDISKQATGQLPTGSWESINSAKRRKQTRTPKTPKPKEGGGSKKTTG